MNTRPCAVSPLLLCLVWMGLPRVGLAAQDAPLAPPPAELSGPVAAGDAGDAEVDESWGRPEKYRAPVGLRLLTEVGAGLATSVVGGAAVVFASYGVCEVTGLGKSGFFGCVGVAYLFGLLGLVEGYGLGVWWGGEVVGGDGGLLFSLLGVTVGAVASGVLAGVLSFQGTVQPLFLALPIMLGGHLGYELSQRSEPSPARASRPGVQPVLGFSSQGALLGLGGRF